MRMPKFLPVVVARYVDIPATESLYGPMGFIPRNDMGPYCPGKLDTNSHRAYIVKFGEPLDSPRRANGSPSLPGMFVCTACETLRWHERIGPPPVFVSDDARRLCEAT